MSNQGDSGFTQGLILGTLIGGTIGAISALLLAPKAGSELRRDLVDRSQDLYDRTTDYLYTAESDLGSAVSNTVNEGKLRAQNIINSARSQAEDILSKAESILHEAKSKTATAKAGVEDKISNLKSAAKASAEAFKKELGTSGLEESNT